MHIFVELPSWLGDSVMTTPTIESLVRTYPDATITLFGSALALSIYQHHPNVTKHISDTTREGNRLLNIRKVAKDLEQFDYAFSFRSSLMSKWLLFNLQATHKAQYQRTNAPLHQVHRYHQFITSHLKNTEPERLYIHTKTPTTKASKILGINPGATYGSAKRYYPEQFAEVINQVAPQFDEVLIFGSQAEVDIASDIYNEVTHTNVCNLAGTLSLEELIHTIATLDTFITGDSGPMHIASSFSIKTIALFGATDDTDTVGWDANTQVVKQHSETLECMPCKKRTCPLEHHKCMKNITPEQIVSLV